MPGDFIPTRESEFVAWTINFQTRTTATPIPYGISAPQALSYQTLHDTFIDLYTLCSENATRTPSKVVAKQDAKELLIANARMLARQIQGTATVTNEQRSDLGLTVRDVEPTPVPTPVTAPVTTVASVLARIFDLRFADPLAPLSRKKPAGVQGITVFSCVGENPLPAGDPGWKWEGQTTRLQARVQFANSVAGGSKVWFCALFYNPRGENGPACTPVSAYLPMDDAQAEAA